MTVTIERVHFVKWNAFTDEHQQPVFHRARKETHWSPKSKKWVTEMACGYVLVTGAPVTAATMLREYAEGFARPCGRCFP